MSVPNTSPKIEDEFSRINIENGKLGSRNSNGSGAAKHTIPRLPNLSTSKRAEARSSTNLSRLGASANTAGSGLVSKTPTRTTPINNKLFSSGKPLPRRGINPQLAPESSPGAAAKPHATPEFSYMRETLSSSKKANPFSASTSPISRPRHRLTTSHSIGDFSDQRYPPIQRKSATKSIPSDITNLDYGKPRSRFANTNVSPPKRHASHSYTTSKPSPTPKLDVYTRLYNDSKSKNHSQYPPSHTPHTSTALNTHSHNPPHPPPAPAVRRVSNPLEGDREIVKIGCLSELYSIIHQEDPELFEETEETDFTAAEPKSSSEFASIEGPDPSSSLDVYERGELLRSKDIYFLPEPQGQASTNRRINIRNFNTNYGFDDQSGNYVVIPQDHIKYRYEIVSVLGNGSFGNVVKCWDKKYTSKQGHRNKTVAIKIIKNDLNWSVQAVYEIKMLKLLNVNRNPLPVSDDPYEIEYGQKNCPVLTYYDHFHFRGHMCIVTEALSVNLYSMLEIVKFQGLSLKLLKVFMKKILSGLQYIHSMNVLHCDIKPENIMIKLPSPENLEDATDESLVVKIVDFGSSCIKNEISYSYIQSRFYRAPEVIIGAKYDKMIDIWSLGCIATELFTGDPLLPGKNELEQIALVLELFGAPSSSLILQQRNTLLRSIKEERAVANLDDRSMTNPVHLQTGKADAKSIKKTLLYTLFDMDGKINMQFLNMRIQAAQSFNAATAPQSKKVYKISSRSLEVSLRLRSCKQEQRDASKFLKFLERIFKWDPTHRADSMQLLEDPFITS